jgi:hypothetical protein
MGNSNSPLLSTKERADPARYVTEVRLKRIQELHVSSAAVASLIISKAANMPAVRSIVFSDDIPVAVQVDVARHLGKLRSVTAVVFRGCPPTDALLDAVLRLPCLASLQIEHLRLSQTAAHLLLASLRQISGQRRSSILLRLNSVTLPADVQLTVLAQAAGDRCEMINMADTTTM